MISELHILFATRAIYTQKLVAATSWHLYSKTNDVPGSPSSERAEINVNNAVARLKRNSQDIGGVKHPDLTRSLNMQIVKMQRVFVAILSKDTAEAVEYLIWDVYNQGGGVSYELSEAFGQKSTISYDLVKRYNDHVIDLAKAHAQGDVDVTKMIGEDLIFDELLKHAFSMATFFQIGIQCAICAAPAAGVCTKCDATAYCGAACQEQHWPQHQAECIGRKASSSGGKFGKVLGEYKRGELHSGSKHGPVVRNRKQALAIAYSEARRRKK